MKKSTKRLVAELPVEKHNALARKLHRQGITFKHWVTVNADKELAAK